MVSFAGYRMPMEYSGIISEHRAVRTRLGMFDLSHMGEFHVRGPQALQEVDHLMTNQIANLDVGQARYTPMCRADGRIIDDLLVYRYPNHVMLVVNASNIEKDFTWIAAHLGPGAAVTNVSDEIALIAVQGPGAVPFVRSFSPIDIGDIAYYHFVESTVSGITATISRTGYTGEDGVELYVNSGDASMLWQSFVAVGDDAGLVLVGLGARDTLRLEAGLALYGNDITEDTNPLEGGLAWAVKLDAHQFIGAETLARQKADGLTRRLVAFEMLDRAIPRPHLSVLAKGIRMGEVTSGTFSPTLGKGIGLASVASPAAKIGTEIAIDVRGREHPAHVVKKPIYSRSG